MRLFLLLCLLLSGCDRFAPAPVEEPPEPGLTGSLVVGLLGTPPSTERALTDLRSSNPGLNLRFVTLEVSEPPGLGSQPLDLVFAHDAAELVALGEQLKPLGQHPAPLPPFADPLGRWVPLGVRARVLLARRILANPPTGLVDIAEPRFKGRLARPPAAFVDTLVEALLANRGEQPARDLVDGLLFNEGDGALVLPDSDAVVAAVFSNKAAAGVAEHDAVHRHLFPSLSPEFTNDAAHRAVSEAPVHLLPPDADASGVTWTASAAGIPVAAPHPELARALIDRLLTPDGQQGWARATREYPVTADATPLPGLAEPAQFTWAAAGPADLLNHAARARELVEAAGLR